MQNDLGGDFSQKRVRLSTLTIEELKARAGELYEEWMIANDKATDPTLPRRVRVQATRDKRNFGIQRVRIGKELRRRQSN